MGLIARIVLGGACGLALATSAGMSLPFAAVIASIGALFEAFAGYNVRRLLVSQAHLPDVAVALAEDVVGIAGGLLIVSHV